MNNMPASDSRPRQQPVLSAGVVVVRREREGHLFLLLRAYNYWDFPKGLVEPGERPLLAAVRETNEEAGIDDLHFPWGEIYYETEPYNRGRKLARYYLAVTKVTDVVLPVSEELGRPEHHEFRWLGYREARQLLVARLKKVIDWAEESIDP